MTSVRLLVMAVAALVVAAGAARAQEYPKPGPEQEALKQWAGTWAATVKMYMQPDKPEESKGELISKMDVGGFFLVSEFTGNMFGAEFKGRSITGYDPFKKKYTGVWVDSMSPALYSIEGSFDKAGKVFTETMEGPDPMGKTMKMRMVSEIKDKDQIHVKMYGTEPGADKERLMMEISYTRKK